MTEYKHELAMGRVSGKFVKGKYGLNSDVDTGGWEVIWNGGGSEYTGFNAVEAQTFRLASSNDEDKPSGTGLGYIRMFYLDENYNPQVADVELNGLTPVVTTFSGIRCDTLKGIANSEENSKRKNLGEITVSQSVDTANVFAVVPIEHNSTMISCYTVPAGHTALMEDLYAFFSGQNRGVAQVRLKIREYGSVPIVAGQGSILADGTSFIHRDLEYFSSPIPEKTDIWIEANADTNNLSITSGFTLVVEKNR